MGYNAAVIDPDHLHKYLPKAKVLLLSHHDYFGFGPPSSTFASIFKSEPLNARCFRRLMESDTVRKAKNNGLKIIAGGPSAWQFHYREDFMREHGIDCVVEGEGENAVVEIVEKALHNEELPRFVEVAPKDSPLLDEIPTIRYPSVNGIVEVMRGCPRGCRFCSVTQRPLRFYPLKKIEEELKINRRAGVKNGILHSDDVLLYGADGIIPNEEKLIPLMKLGKKYYRNLIWSHTSIAAMLSKPKLMEHLYEIIIDDRQRWWSAEIGIETGSVSLAKKIMPQKAKPFKVEEWPELVVQAAGMMQDLSFIPAMTLIAGLPEETEDDVMKTLELLDDLWEFDMLIVPLFFVPMGKLKDKEWFRAHQLSPTHITLLKACLTHGLKASKRILRNYFREKWYWPLITPQYLFFVERMEVAARRRGYLITRPKEVVKKKLN